MDATSRSHVTKRGPMIRFLIRLVLLLAGNALGLWITALVLDDVSVSGTAFITAVVIFTVLEFVLQPFVAKMAEEHAPVLERLTSLITTFLALLLTALFSDGLDVDGALAWVLATLIVWLTTMIAAFVLGRIFLPEVPDEE